MRQFQRAFFASVVAATGFTGVATAAGVASEYCVTCDGPAAHYACTVDGRGGTATDTSIKLLCITELAKSGQHASCSVDRQQQTPCKGDIRNLALPGVTGIETPANSVTVQAPSQPGTEPPAAAATAPPPATQTDIPKTPGPPKTVKDAVDGEVASTGKAIEDGGNAASDAAKATGSALQKAGEAVGDAAKKTWNCIISFGDC